MSDRERPGPGRARGRRPEEARTGKRDFEFGVPFAGREQPREKWTRTRWLDPDPALAFDWQTVFGRDAPRVLDLGCGNGRYLIASAQSRPNRDHLGIDEVQRVIDYAVMRANRRAIPNLRFAVGDARAFVERRLAADSVDEVHVYHPQPYYEDEDRTRRLLDPAFLLRAHALLRRGGLLVLQTDNPYYWDYLLRAVPALFEADVLPGPWPDAPRGRTRREIIALGRGLPIFRVQARRRDDLGPEEAAARAAAIPAADFDANRPRFRRRPGQDTSER